MTTPRSLIVLLLSGVLLIAGTFFATKYFYAQKGLAATEIEFETTSDRPTVTPVRLNPDVRRDARNDAGSSGQVLCDKNIAEENVAGFEKDCVLRIRAEEIVALPDLQSLFDADNNDIELGKYDNWAYTFGNTAYILGHGLGYAVGITQVVTVDLQTKKVTQIFDCSFSRCEILEHALVFFSVEHTEKQENLYRISFYQGTVNKELVATIPDDNNGWVPGIVCVGDPCFGGQLINRILDENTVVLRFDRQTNPGKPDDEDIKTETRYILLDVRS